MMALKSADTTTLASAKEEVIKSSESFTQAAEEYTEEFNRVNALSFDEIQETAIDEAKELSGSGGGMFGNIIVTIFLGGILWLYNKSQQSYGYTISRHRFERKIIDRIQRFIEWVTIKMLKLVGYDISIKDHSTTTEYVAASGTVVYTKEDPDVFALGGNFLIVIVKLMLLMLAFIIAMLSSSILIVILTLYGLHCNYGWRNIFGKIKDYIVSTIATLKVMKSELKEIQEEKAKSKESQE